MNANKLRDNIWIGNKLAASDRTFLETNGITTVLNVAEDAEDPDLGVPIVKVPLNDGCKNQQTTVDMAVSILCDLINAGEIVLVHCMAGHSRAPYVTARAVSQLENRTYDDCYTEIRGIRAGVVYPERLRPLYGPP